MAKPRFQRPGRLKPMRVPTSTGHHRYRQRHKLAGLPWLAMTSWPSAHAMIHSRTARHGATVHATPQNSNACAATCVEAARHLFDAFCTGHRLDEACDAPFDARTHGSTQLRMMADMRPVQQRSEQ